MIQEIAQVAQSREEPMGIVHLALSWIYVLAHQIGLGVVKALGAIFPGTVFPADIVDPIGFVVILLAFYLLVNFAKSVAKWVLIIAGGLIILRIVLVILKVG